MERLLALLPKREYDSFEELHGEVPDADKNTISSSMRSLAMKLTQLAKDPAPMPKSVAKPEDTVKTKSEDGDWRGGNEYYKMKAKPDFSQPDAIDGHKQQQNVDE